ncbi:stalk domain-containing protein [Natranaerobius thermophilus]|uniref:Copper amine oxidase domain protein n=1 Tax=Natranaerobius thermophilus (strain ATCC BAA-1301 / DSM 18059 / JW/NM-WN-LF) TaxID=457570 RepID=B2A0W7_NATTJ|nr:stalk domain-containing protein [Natranaerobius thermophilus]ACB85997.1 copper amine oxidase domain protein [Natranaerobius thermophilus JW/NM-WN-LF]
MKKLIYVLTVIAIIFYLVHIAREPPKQVDFKIDGQDLNITVNPIKPADEVLIPARFIFEPLGGELNWNGEKQITSISFEDKYIEFPIDSKEITVNNSKRKLADPIILQENRTYIPLEFAQEVLTAEARWNSATNTVVLDIPEKAFNRDFAEVKEKVQSYQKAREKSQDYTTDPKETAKEATNNKKNKQENSDPVKSEELIAHFIDVGQGDAIFIETPCDSHILVDAGQNWEGETVVTYLEELEINEIAKVVATHPHADHIGGLTDIYKNFEVDVTYDSGYEHDTQTYQEYYDLANKNSDFQIARTGDTLDLSCLEAEFIYPPEGKGEAEEVEVHDLNLILNINYGKQSILLTGDAEIPAEKEIIANHSELLPSDILKVGHHGSETSTSEDFLEIVDPEAAVIQVGEDNRYDHPHDEVLSRLEDNGAKIYRNDYHGNIVITIEDSNWEANVEPWN